MSVRFLSKIAGFAVTWMICVTARPQAIESGSLSLPGGDASRALEEVKSQWSVDLLATWNYDTGHPRHLFGKPLVLDRALRSDAELEDAGRDFIDSFPELFGYDSRCLVLRGVKDLLLRRIGSSDKTAVVFDQEVEGLRVEGGSLTFLFDDQGRIVSIDNLGLPGVLELSLSPQVGDTAALSIARAEFGQDVSEVRSVPELVITRSRDETHAVLAWSVELRGGADEDGLPIQSRISVDARTGEVLRSRSTVHTFTDLIGHTEGWATPGVYPDKSTNPEQLFNLDWVRMTSAVGNTNTDVNGDWTITNSGTTNEAVTAAFGGGSRYAWVLDEGGSEITLTQDVPPGIYTNFQLNAAVTEFDTAEVNAQRHVVVFREWIRALDPTDGTMDFRVRANVNINSSCNAYYDGVSINFYRAGGGCVNTAYSSIVAHEEGHWANDAYGSGNGFDGFGEGNADAWAMYIYDDAVVGRDFCGNGCNIRNGNNTRKYCGSCGAGCYGESHADGEVLMGALWKVRSHLNNTHGDVQGDLIADVLFLSWMQVYNDATICKTIRDHWLVLDDDDGDLLNGTPNGCDVDAGFVDQGFPRFYDDSAVAIVHTPLAEVQPEQSFIEVRARASTAICGGGGTVTAMQLSYSVNGGAYAALDMFPTANPGEWLGVLPPFPSPSTVHYHLTGFSSTGGNGTFPGDAPLDDRLVFYVGTVKTLAFYNFEAADDEGWTHQQIRNQDDWQRDRPKGKSTDPADAYSGTRAWGNDVGNSGWNGEYLLDVNNILRSPVFDFTAEAGLHVQFRRWLGVQDRDFDKARFRTNDWIVLKNPDDRDLLDDHWTLQEFDISSNADHNPSVQFSFDMLSNSSVEYGGWNVDDFRVIALSGSGSGCPSPLTYGTGTAGSLGITPLLYSVGGAPFLGNLSFTLVGERLLGGSLAIFVVGSARANLRVAGIELLVEPLGARFLPVPTVGTGPGLGRAELLFVIPGDPAFDGLLFDAQVIGVDPGGPLGLSASNGLEGVMCQ